MVILRFMIEACWAPMLAAFSVPLDQSDDLIVINLCLEGFHHAIHATSLMSMKTHRDAFVTSLAKFTSLHSPADIKQKNIEAIKVGFLLDRVLGDFCLTRFPPLLYQKTCMYLGYFYPI